MVIPTLTESDLQNSEFIFNLITEVSKSVISKDVKKQISKQSTRNEMYDKYGEDAFLLPKEKKFPIINPKTGKVDCGLLYAARIRAAQHGYNEIKSKAEKLYNENGCQNKININIQDHENTYDLADLLNLVECDFTFERQKHKILSEAQKALNENDIEIDEEKFWTKINNKIDALKNGQHI